MIYNLQMIFAHFGLCAVHVIFKILYDILLVGKQARTYKSTHIEAAVKLAWGINKN